MTYQEGALASVAAELLDLAHEMGMGVLMVSANAEGGTDYVSALAYREGEDEPCVTHARLSDPETGEEIPI